MTLLIKLLESPWFWLDVFLSVFGGLIVWRGLSIESNAETLLPPDSFRRDIFGDIIERYRSEIKHGEKLVRIGVIIEVVAALGISIVSGLESATLSERTSQAEKDAAVSKQEAAQANERAANTESNNLVLQKELQPRIITLKQITNFIFLTRKIRKVHVKVAFAYGRNETANYAYQIRNMLNEAGFPPETNADEFGIDPDHHYFVSALTENTNWPAIILINYGTNLHWNYYAFPIEHTNGFLCPILPKETNNVIISEALMSAFQQIEIPTIEDRFPFVKRGQFEFVIMDRAH
jgi:hypothetical protein